MSMPVSIDLVVPPPPWRMFSTSGTALPEPAADSPDESGRSAAEGTAGEDFDLDELYQSSYHDMVRLARQFVDDVESAQDVVHDAFLGLHRNRSRLQKSENAKAYLRASVLNHARSALRRRRTARAYEQGAEPDIAPGAEEPVLIAEEHAEVLKHLDTLPPRMREVLVLRYWEGLSEAEIAQTLDIRPGTVKSQAARGLAKLAEAMRGSDV